MDPGEPAPKPFQQPEKPGRVRRRKTRGRVALAGVGSHWPAQHPPVVRDHGIAEFCGPTAAKLVVATQGRLSQGPPGSLQPW